MPDLSAPSMPNDANTTDTDPNSERLAALRVDYLRARLRREDLRAAVAPQVHSVQQAYLKKAALLRPLQRRARRQHWPLL